MKTDKINRRSFIKTASIGLTGFFVWLWYAMVGKQKQTAVKKRVVVALENQQKVFFNDDLVIIQGEQPLVLSARCPHLGCRINKLEGNNLICPCHGSSFDLKGEVLTGPAVRPLKALEYTLGSDGKQLIVDL